MPVVENSYDVRYISSTINTTAELGTIEKDASGYLGKFEQEPVRGAKILDKFLTLDYTTVLDIGAGGMQHTNIFLDNDKIVDVCDYGNSTYYCNKIENKSIRNTYIGDFNKIVIPEKYDAIWCSHILEHQLNVNSFLKKINILLKEDGYLCIVVPPRKPYIIGGHMTLWNAGLVLYNLVMAGFDCSKYCKIKQYDYNIGVIIQKKSFNIDNEKISMDIGDIEILSKYFPFKVQHNFNGDIMEFNW